MERPYHEQVDIRNTKKLRELCRRLPSFASEFFRGIEQVTSSRTRIAYAYDLKVFFDYLLNEVPDFAGKTMADIRVTDLDLVTTTDLEEFMEYMKYYVPGEGASEEVVIDRTNKELGIKRKMAGLRSFYNYFYRKQVITTNPPSLVKLPKTHEKVITRLDTDEVARLLDIVEDGGRMSKAQERCHEKTAVRDLAIMTLMLGTGIRVSECVGLDIRDVDFRNDGIRVHRKGGKEVIVYFGDEVERALLDYLEERKLIIPVSGHEQALFLSLQKKRISVRSVENLVKKYARQVTTIKNITPHKLRSTYGTNLYRETDDIYLVADVLGHSDVNTTKKHYAALEDEHRRSARNKVKLRDI
ncbi:MAG: tyrosine-type recombinase/integrase [Lachnospiraceae bacterium]|nr:tyrosine-type recombinase/integrase [Lachnospiraceae bacterium]MBR2738947.1 tyrosine-type recombinase/integrase [Lachnospiraceae bacterium]